MFSNGGDLDGFEVDNRSESHSERFGEPFRLGPGVHEPDENHTPVFLAAQSLAQEGLHLRRKRFDPLTNYKWVQFFFRIQKRLLHLGLVRTVFFDGFGARGLLKKFCKSLGVASAGIGKDDGASGGQCG